MLTLWKESYDQPRQHIKKQRHYFVNKGPSRQGYGFSSSHIWMWELDYKESWVQKNWCFWTVVLEKTLESPLDSKEIQPVHPKGKQSVQLLSHVWLCATPWTTARQASLSITNSQSPLKPVPIELVMTSSHLILCRPLLFLPSVFPSIRVFSNESALHITWPKHRSFCFNISPSNEHPGLIFFRMNWLDLLAVQRTLKSLQHHSSKASTVWHTAFFIVQLSHPYITIGKTIALTKWIFVGKVMSLLFNMMSTLVIAFLPRSKRLLISQLQENKVYHGFHCSPIDLPWSDGTWCHHLSFLNAEL